MSVDDQRREVVPDEENTRNKNRNSKNIKVQINRSQMDAMVSVTALRQAKGLLLRSLFDR